MRTRIVLAILLMLLLFFLVTACERNATRSAWSPINGTPGLTVQRSTGSQTIPLPKNTPIPISTPEYIPTLDMSSLSETYPVAFKGYELLSWRYKGDWVFTLMTGTNRAKSFEEILSAENQYSTDALIKITVRGIDDLKVVLERLPRGEQINWGGMNLEGEVPANTLYFTYPPEEIVEEVVNFCHDAGITLVTLTDN